MLVVVEDRNINPLLQFGLDIKALGCFDILKIDPPQGRCNHLAKTNDVVGVFGVDLDVEDVYVGKTLEEHRLAFHDRFGRQRTTIAQPQNRRPIGDHSDKVALCSVVKNKFRVISNGQDRIGDTWRISQRKIALCLHWLGSHNFELSRPTVGVIIQ